MQRLKFDAIKETFGDLLKVLFLKETSWLK
jgi:hypothetical protein